MRDQEIEALETLNAVLGGLKSKSGRARVLRWAAERYAPEILASRAQSDRTARVTKDGRAKSVRTSSNSRTVDLSDIGRLGKITPTGRFRLLVTDPKAKSMIDAAIRLTLITVRVHQLLTERKTTPTKLVLPILKKWRVYDANCRKTIAEHPGIRGTGHALKLSAEAQTEADGYIANVLNDKAKGNWHPS